LEEGTSSIDLTSGAVALIDIDDLSVLFGRTIALDHINLSLAPGIVGLFGQNASGKSTLLRVLGGLLPPTSGAVTWDGSAIGRGEEQRARVGFAGHESGLYLRLSIHENLILFAQLYGVSSHRVDEVADALRLTPRLTTPVGALSAGFKRRAGVARALLHEPDLLLLDEPYAHLDDQASEAVSEAVRSQRTARRGSSGSPIAGLCYSAGGSSPTWTRRLSL
jgi:ABC-type multidrug transport system ATPase subunit